MWLDLYGGFEKKKRKEKVVWSNELKDIWIEGIGLKKRLYAIDPWVDWLKYIFERTRLWSCPVYWPNWT